MPMEIDPAEVYALFEGIKEIGPKMMELWGADFLAVVDEEVPVDTHNLQWSIPANTVKDDWMWVVGTNVEYAAYVHEGHMTRPSHVNTPQGKMRYGGDQRFIPGNPWFDRTITITEGRLDEYLERATEGLE